jgi:hypothetical protein
MTQASHDITILGVNFSDELLEITFSESRLQNDHAAMVNQLLLQSRECGDRLHIILEELRELVDHGLVLLRDPPQVLDPRERMRQAARGAERGDPFIGDTHGAGGSVESEFEVDPGSDAGEEEDG